MEQIIIAMFITSVGVVIQSKADNEYLHSAGAVMMWTGLITLTILFITVNLCQT